jgi:transposase InsO family protein
VARPYPREFRDDVVRVARNRDDGVTIEQIANDFGVHPITLSKWMRRADIDGTKPGSPASESAELRELRRRNRLLEQENEFGYRDLVEEARTAGEPMAQRTAWRICSQHRLWSVFGKKRGKNGKTGPPVHDDLVERDFTAYTPNQLWLSDITEHSTREGKLYPLCDQGCILQPDRRLLHGLADEIQVGDHRPAQRGCPPRRGGRLHRPHRQRVAIS